MGPYSQMSIIILCSYLWTKLKNAAMGKYFCRYQVECYAGHAMPWEKQSVVKYIVS